MEIFQAVFDITIVLLVPFVWIQLSKSRKALRLSEDTRMENQVITTLVKYPLGLRLTELASALRRPPSDLLVVLEGLRSDRVVMASPARDGTNRVKYHLA
jgi:hypothetical protein